MNLTPPMRTWTEHVSVHRTIEWTLDEREWAIARQLYKERCQVVERGEPELTPEFRGRWRADHVQALFAKKPALRAVKP